MVSINQSIGETTMNEAEVVKVATESITNEFDVEVARIKELGNSIRSACSIVDTIIRREKLEYRREILDEYREMLMKVHCYLADTKKE